MLISTSIKQNQIQPATLEYSDAIFAITNISTKFQLSNYIINGYELKQK